MSSKRDTSEDTRYPRKRGDKKREEQNDTNIYLPTFHKTNANKRIGAWSRPSTFGDDGNQKESKYKKLQQTFEEEVGEREEGIALQARTIAIIALILTLLGLIGLAVGLGFSIYDFTKILGLSSSVLNGGEACPPGGCPNGSTVRVGNTTTGDPGTDANVVNAGNATDLVLNFTIPRGEPGENGSCTGMCTNGTSATVDAGTTTTGLPGSFASVVNVGDTTNAVFDFTIPRGDPGVDGNCTDLCVNGTNGTSSTVDVGTTTTGPPGSFASVVNVGDTTNAIFDFTIPRGDPGVDGNCTDLCVNGTNGTSATVDAGTTTTGPPGSFASVVNIGDTTNAVFDFTIPRGDPGVDGNCTDLCVNGTNGTSATVDVGTTTTGPPGSFALVVNSGDTTNAIFDFTIPRGDPGEDGNCTGQCINGTDGTDGANGTSATVDVGTTTTGPPGSFASVVNVGDTTNAIFDFTIPRGDPGENGTCTEPCVNGTSSTVDAGTTTTGPPGSFASVVNVGDTTNAIFDFTIPRGDPGENGTCTEPCVNGTSATADVGSTTTGPPGSFASVVNSGDTTNAIFDFTIPRGDPGENGTCTEPCVNGTAATVDVGTTTTGPPGSFALVVNSGDTTNAIFDFTIPRGDPGENGTCTEPCVNGTDGNSATVDAGTTTTGAAGTQASVVNTGTVTNAVFNFTIPRGDPGVNGTNGTSATVDAGTTTTGAAGSQASVVNTGTTTNAVFNFTIPRGDPGENGTCTAPCTNGTNGTAATITVGTTTTGAAGSSASVVNTGTSTNAVFNFTIPRGDPGTNGTNGISSYYFTNSSTALLAVTTSWASLGSVTINVTGVYNFMLDGVMTKTSGSPTVIIRIVSDPSTPTDLCDSERIYVNPTMLSQYVTSCPYEITSSPTTIHAAWITNAGGMTTRGRRFTAIKVQRPP